MGALVDQFQAAGRYWFTRADVAGAYRGSEIAIRPAALRLQQQSGIVKPHRGFYVIVQLEYRPAGAPPSELRSKLFGGTQVAFSNGVFHSAGGH